MFLRSNKIDKSDTIGSLTTDEIEPNSHFIYSGIHYGYPMCCITFFVTPFHISNAEPEGSAYF